MKVEFPPGEFDVWAEHYDDAVKDESSFPFEGYSRVLQTVFEQSQPGAGLRVLDLGTGTGNLAQLYLAAGCEVWGIDFSTEMVALARRKLPEAHFTVADVRGGWPPEFGGRYDRIVSAYTFHHFPLAEKVNLVEKLLTTHLQPGGAGASLVIADLAFHSQAREEAYAQKVGDAWEPEYYWRADETRAALAGRGLTHTFTPVSACAGVFRFLPGQAS